jgi:hypothetical protein
MENPGLKPVLLLAEEDNFSGEFRVLDQFICLRGLAQREPQRDQRLNFSLREQIKKSFQIRSKPARLLLSQICDVVPDAAASIWNQPHNSQQEETEGARDLAARNRG